MKLIPTRVHGMLDYVVGLGLMGTPWLLGFDGMHAASTWVPVALGGATLLYSVLTDYELGAFRVIPMPAHLALDAANGLFLAFSPWLLGFSDVVWAPHLALGLFELLVVAVSDRQPEDARLSATGPFTSTGSAAS